MKQVEREIGRAVHQSVSGEWIPYEFGDEKFIEYGDMVAFERDGERVEATVKGANDDLLGVELPDGERKTIEVYDVIEYRSDTDDLSTLREQLRSHFEDMGIGPHSGALEQYTNDNKYREIQDHLRSARSVAADSPVFDSHPEMETISAILATASESEAQLIRDIHQWAKADLPREMVVYRGVDVDVGDFLTRAESVMDSGGRLSDPGFQSATIDREVAAGFGNVVLEIHTDHGVYVRAASQHAGEDEVLLPAGTEYEVLSVDRGSKTVEVRAHDGFDFGINVDGIRQLMETEGLSYPEAVNRVI